MNDRATIKNRLRRLLDPCVSLLVKAGVPPLGVTIAGLILSFAGAFAIARGELIAGGVLLIVSGVCDTLDGSLARRSGKESVFGAFIDSTIDRVAELAYFGALIMYYVSREGGGRFAVPLVVAALAGSFLTSYTRARAEGLGIDCRVGLLERPERVALLVLGLLLGRTALFVVIACLAVLTLVTTIQRIVHVHRMTSGRGTGV
ncbi:MAG: CDP-alcohol phosphatidyltransferase family protein [Candidatus Krumholzibacteria bacterium]|nr:CDP-alcohol phosphatidyltransferase family protein [Candidatus Krumholzibacteria bacterium]